MYKVKIEFTSGSSLDYTSRNKDEINKIIHCLENNIPLDIIEGNRTILVVPQNVLFLDVSELQEEKTSSSGMGFLIRCIKCGKVSTIKSKDEGRNVCYECKGGEEE
ncbi:hypothetical protein [Streptococcus pseudoporcinus]|uniref:Phage protein n=1 Tax=Streptococcus pseudoporcinus TaxID=361101 RepID=A0A4U9XJL0_9STRE|nr:hypothetical protein [Streptococcus pseudoporcinus]QBX28199.1 hypothetical protein Javan444_0037 [Streptococcus phage Javan444]VTS13179.1 Uncharacterised protein [Streptococcus pseudoporcinus]VUC66393.1 Uncharacterised protein [Streptococcus pseudoporcinus]VUC97321.1 Uncharacterised protein [Streptococcus pseudoporcinus]VUC97709.1 Uncharacterised protein [Streptococcus pseudoporcinus]